MKVLVVSVCFPPAWRGGGSVRSIGSMAAGLAAAGADVHVVTTDAWLGPAERPARRRTEQGMTVDTVRTPAWLGRRVNRFGLAPGLFSAVAAASRHADVCLAQGVWTFPLFVAARICRSRRLPYVVCAQGSLEWMSLAEKAGKKRVYMRWVESATLRHAAAILFNSDEERERSRATCSEAASIVLPNAIETVGRREPPRGRLQDQLGIPRDRLVIGMSGRINARKGFDVLLPALERTDRRVHCVAFGPDDGYAATALQLAARSNVADRFHLLDHRAGAELEETYAALDLLVLPSHGESFGYVVLEALAQATPVMVSAEVPLAPYVAEHGFGAVVEDLSAAAWAGALERWAAGDGGLDVASAPERVGRDFAVAAIGRRLRSDMESLL